MSQLFPTLVNIATQILNTPPANASHEIPLMLHLILKTYKTSIVLHLSPHQQRPESLVPWGRLLFQVVNLQIPKEAVPEDEEERERSEWWKAKKWAYKILGRLFHRFGNPSQLPSSLQKDYGQFAENFVTTFAPQIFKIYLEQIQLFVSGTAWLSKKCQYRIFTYFTEWYVTCGFRKSAFSFMTCEQREAEVDLGSPQASLPRPHLQLRLPSAFLHAC